MATPERQLHRREESRRIRVRGLVQGVGFRPTVWRLARRFGLRGSVCNDGAGVLIEATAHRCALDGFITALEIGCPPLARIDAVEQAIINSPVVANDFEIVESTVGAVSTGVVADAATCAECLSELFDQDDRRYRYPFSNCTHCGPRFSITGAIPYDRANTSMAAFIQCPACANEYRDPADRRFHAQPNACAVCGPSVWLERDAAPRVRDVDAIEAAAGLLENGAIVAIKGIGGFHLACDARNADAVATLRRRKRRPAKPLALMARNLDEIRHYCIVDAVAADALTSPAAPIVVLELRARGLLPEGIAPGQHRVGFMLPYSPLHHLLMARLSGPVVLTSGNLSEEPQCIDNAEAGERLSTIADALLLHDRPIVNRIDDSVAHVDAGELRLLRRARGYAPGHLPLPPGFDMQPALLAMGGELKNTFCLLRDGHAVLSQHMGDLEDAATYDDYLHNLTLYRDLYRHAPEAIAIDRHPDYLSAKVGRQLAIDEGLELIAVQHHHAHVAACMADNGVARDHEAVLGIALDGLGFGDDGTLWGGEILLADYRDYRRLARLKPVAMPGGSQAIREPWRNAVAQLHAALGLENLYKDQASLVVTRRLADHPTDSVCAMIDKGIQAPLSSSVGRLFDAVSWVLGITPDRISYEGEAAIGLESQVDSPALTDGSQYEFQPLDDGDLVSLDPTPMWQQLLTDLAAGVTSDVISARFHAGLALALSELAGQLAARETVDTVALTGGVFQNRTLHRLVRENLLAQGLKVLCHRQVPANDGGLALGQALIAAARLQT